MKIRLISCCMLLCSLMSYSQTWQWGQRGGSSDTYTVGPDETVVDMATDPHGNVYVLSKVMQTGLNVGGHTITNYGGYDILITSFKCDGTYRWSKDIGSNQDDLPVAIKTDTLGGVYVCGSYGPSFSTFHIDADTSWTESTYQGYFLLKYDTAGTYKWLRLPQADTIGLYSMENTGIFDMDVDGNGNVYMLWLLAPGAYAGGSYVVSGSPGVYILKYDSNGNFASGNPMQITNSGVNIALFYMKKDFKNGRYYITGSLPNIGGMVTFGSIPVTHMQYLGCFDHSGTFLWQRQGTDAIAYYSAFGRATIDVEDNVYLGGRASNTDTFNGYVMINGGSTGEPVVFKIDTNGNNVWAKNATVNGLTNCGNVVLNRNEVEIAGSYPGKLKWPGYPDSLNLAFGAGYHLFITRFNASTGAVLGMDSLADAGVSVASMTADRFGNFYVGGNFTNTLTVNGTTLSSAGGGSDFFVAKYGTANCDTVLVPTLETPPGPFPGQVVLKVYPNPATEELNVTGINQATAYRLLTMTGVAIQQGVLQPGENTIGMQRCAAGMYILEMTGADGTRNVVRVMKE